MASFGGNWRQRVTKSLGERSESAFRALTMPGFRSRKDTFAIGLSGLKHVINDSGQLVRSSSDRFGGSEPGSHATIEGAQSRFTLLERLSRHSQCDGNPVVDLSRPGPKHLSATDVIVRA